MDSNWTWVHGAKKQSSCMPCISKSNRYTVIHCLPYNWNVQKFEIKLNFESQTTFESTSLQITIISWNVRIKNKNIVCFADIHAKLEQECTYIFIVSWFEQCLFRQDLICLEADSHDYRGWYGLGQLYDILKMPSYSLYYYQQAHKCK